MKPIQQPQSHEQVISAINLLLKEAGIPALQLHKTYCISAHVWVMEEQFKNVAKAQSEFQSVSLDSASWAQSTVTRLQACIDRSKKAKAEYDKSVDCIKGLLQFALGFTDATKPVTLNKVIFGEDNKTEAYVLS